MRVSLGGLILSALIFLLLSLIAIMSAFSVILMRNSVHAVMWLVVTFFSVAGLFILQGAEYLAMTLMVIYAGAVAVMFLFIVMMVNMDLKELKKVSYTNIAAGLCFVTVLSVELFLVLGEWEADVTNDIDHGFNLLPHSVSSVVMIGQVLFSDYVVHFLIGGCIMFVAMVGAIVLTLQERDGRVKTQSVLVQLGRERDDSVTLMDPPIGKGLVKDPEGIWK